MNKYSKFLAILTSIFAITSAAATTYEITNSATIKIGVEFYYFTDLMNAKVISEGQVVQVNAADSSNYVNVRPYPDGLWTGAVIRMSLSNVKDNKFTVSSINTAANKVRLEVKSGGATIGSGEFTKKMIIKRQDHIG